MTIRTATQLDTAHWIALRAMLWPGTAHAKHRTETAAILAGCPDQSIAFVHANGSQINAFAEASLRHDHVNGCRTSPVAFLEGIYVQPDAQGTGIGRQLIDAVGIWAKQRGCSELASDAHLANTDSHAFHNAAGFTETQRVVFFRKPLP